MSWKRFPSRQTRRGNLNHRENQRYANNKNGNSVAEFPRTMKRLSPVSPQFLCAGLPS